MSFWKGAFLVWLKAMKYTLKIAQANRAGLEPWFQRWFLWLFAWSELIDCVYFLFIVTVGPLSTSLCFTEMCFLQCELQVSKGTFWSLNSWVLLRSLQRAQKKTLRHIKGGSSQQGSYVITPQVTSVWTLSMEGIFSVLIYLIFHCCG